MPEAWPHMGEAAARCRRCAALSIQQLLQELSGRVLSTLSSQFFHISSQKPPRPWVGWHTVRARVANGDVGIWTAAAVATATVVSRERAAEGHRTARID